MAAIMLQVEAGPGVKIKVGDKVKKGEKIGISPDQTNLILSPVNGIIEDISFDGQGHLFVVKVKEL